MEHRLQKGRTWILSSGSTLFQGLLDLLLPPRCFLCGAFDQADHCKKRPGFCPECLAGMTPLPEARCIICGRPFETGLTFPHACAQCLRKRPRFDLACSAGIYDHLLQKAIHRLKYSAQTELARPLARFMAAQLAPPFYPPETDLIIPVPLHHRRLKQRGFNQSFLLAKALFAPLKRRVRADLMIRSRWTVPQTKLTGAERKKMYGWPFQ